MKRILTVMLCALCMTQAQLSAQSESSADSIANDTTSYKIEQDTINNRINPDDPPPVKPDLEPLLLDGDSIHRPIDMGVKSSDFSCSDTRYLLRYSNGYNGLPTNDVFYCFTLVVPMNVTITHQGSVVTDTYMYLLDSNGIQIDSNDDYDGVDHCTNTLHSFIRRQLAAGTYYVVSESKQLNGTVKTNITGNVSSSFNYPVFPSTYNTDPGTAVGGMGGQFGVSPMGGATYSIPIEVPQGVGGLQPQLSIVYNSQSGNGLCGYGTSLAGITCITRGPKEIYHDGTAQGISYQTVDALYLDGVRLILDENSSAGQDLAVYHPESDPFTRVIEHGVYPSSVNNTWFEVQSSDGMIYKYGTNQDSQLSYTIGNNNRIHSWYICVVQQPTGNYMTYSYQVDNKTIYPSQISYGCNTNISADPVNTITFQYENRNDSVLIRFDGKRGSIGKRLKTITGSTNGNTYRSYSLNYNTTGDGSGYKYSRLTSVTEKNSQNESLHPTQLNWSYIPTVSYVSNSLTVSQPELSNLFISFPFSDQSFMTGDFNNDGFSDIVGIGQAGEPNMQGGYDFYTYVYIYYSSLSSDGTVRYISGTDYVLPPYVEVGQITAGASSLSVVDVEGDGVNELIVPYYISGSSNGILGVYTLGQLFDEDDGICTIGLHGNSKPLFTSGDIDNDGRGNIVFIETSQYNGSYPLYIWKYNNNYIPESNVLEHGLFDMSIKTSMSLASEPRWLYLSDMNGNGVNDLFVICADGYAIFWNLGGPLNSNTFSNSDVSTGSLVKDARSLSPGDFNGDGLLDMLSNSGSEDWYVLYNNGDGTFSQALAFSNSTLADQGFTDRDDNLIFCNVVDFDGDGKSDAIVTKAEYKSRRDTILGIPMGSPWGVFKTVHTYWMCASGSGWSEKYHATSSRYDDVHSSRYITGDFDGDGRMELVNYGYDCVNGNNSNSDPVWRIYKNSNLTAQTGRVTSITGDFGARTDITYTTLTDSRVYNRGGAEPYPAPRYTIPLNVVKQTVQSNGAAGSLTTQYSYEGLKVHLKGRGLLGFSKTTADCTTTGVITESGITQWDTAHYIPKVTYSKSIIGNSYAQTVSTLTVLDKGQKKYYAYPSQIVSTDMDGNTVTTVCSYNTTYGYPLSETSTYGTNMYRSTTYADYVQAGGSYRPQTVIVSQRHPDDTSPFSVTTVYTYDSSTGAVTSKVDNYGTSKPLATQYTYDLWGNLISQVSTGSGITTPCTTYYSYESTHRFPVRIYTNPSSSVMKYTYDVWGNVLSEQDSINASISNTVVHTYDGWNQITGTTRPDGTQTTYTRGWSSDAGCRYYTLTQGTATPWVKTWYDNCGRQVSTLSVGPHDVTSGSTTVYDSNGQVTSHTETEGNLTLTSNYTYDARGRLSSESYTGGRTVSYSYANRTVTVTENNDRNTVRTYDAWGNLKTKSNYASYLTNTYSSNGGILQTVSGGPEWTFTYDDRGNRITMTDPDAGTTTYVYDALGRETSRTDGRGVVYVTEYDYLGRVTQRSAGTEVTSYTYGTSGTGQTRPISESNGSWTLSYGYDNLGRVTSETMSDGTHISKSKTYTYGSNGLLSSRILPGGKGYSYTYDSYGNLVGVDFDSGTIEWNLTGYTGNRTVSRTVLDGSTSHPFIKEIILDSNGLLDSITTCQDNCYYQAHDYGFSAQTGNLTYRRDYSSYYPQTFSYDNADRLIAVYQNNQTIQSMTYSYTDNITYKTGIGTYDYNTTRPHAVEAVDNTAGIIHTDEQYITYNPWGKVSAVLHSDGTDSYNYSIGYGPDQQRITSSMSKNNSLQYEKFYWDDYEEKKVGNDLYQYYYVYGANGLEGLHVVKTTPNNQTTTHTTKVVTDHLGSIMSLIDNSDWVYDASFDTWGKRDVSMPYWFEPGFNRGFTGHEHLDEMGLINMNGRMYDPDLGRFLSPDPFVQSPSNPQNYNRYSYCLNNPLKYTDPSGEKVSGFWAAAVVLNLIPIEAAMAFVTVTTTDAITSGISGLINGGLDEAARRFTNSIKIAAGMLQNDINDGDCYAQFGRSYFRSVWCSPSSLLGYFYACHSNIFDRVDVEYYHGATVLRTNWSTSGVTLGHYIMINPTYEGDEYKSLLIHEYGHFMQSRNYGGLSALSGGLYSLFCASGKGNIVDHSNTWIERDASARGASHLKDDYKDVKIKFDQDNPQEYYKLRMLHNVFVPFSVGFGIYNLFNPN